MRNRKLVRGQLLCAIVAAFLFAAPGGRIWAQGGPGGGGMGGPGGGGGDMGGPQMTMEVQLPHINSVGHDLKQLDKIVSLNSDQKVQVTAILNARNQQIEDLVKQYKDGIKADAAANKNKRSNASNGPARGPADNGGPQVSGPPAMAGNPGGGPPPGTPGGQPGAAAGVPQSIRLMIAAQFLLKKTRTEAETQIAALLTDTQKNSYEAWKAKHGKEQAEKEAQDFHLVMGNGQNAGGPGGGGPGGGGPGGGGPGGGGPGGGGPGI